MSNLAYIGLTFFLERVSPPMVGAAFVLLRIPLTLAAGGVLLGGALVSLTLSPELAPGRFLARTLACLALLEGCALFGLALFFLGLEAREFAVFAAVSLLAQVLLVLPRAVRSA